MEIVPDEVTKTDMIKELDECVEEVMSGKVRGILLIRVDTKGNWKMRTAGMSSIQEAMGFANSAAIFAQMQIGKGLV